MRRVYGMKVVRLTLGGLSSCLDGLPASRGAGMGGQKSAEAVVVDLTNQRRAEPVEGGRTNIPTVLSRFLARGPKPEVAGGTREVGLGA